MKPSFLTTTEFLLSPTRFSAVQQVRGELLAQARGSVAGEIPGRNVFPPPIALGLQMWNNDENQFYLEIIMSVLVYVAGPLFSQAEREFLEKMVDRLALAAHLDPSKHFFLPHRDGGELGKGPTRTKIFNLDINTLKRAEIVVALLDGQDVDSGTCIELGVAYASGKKIFGIITDFRSYCTNDHEPQRPNLMVWGVCEEGNTLFHTLSELSESFASYVKGNIRLVTR